MGLKNCTRHTSDIIAECRRHGLGSLVSGDARKAARCAATWLSGKFDMKDFDPYVIATIEFNQKATQHYLTVLRRDAIAGRDTCPLCVAEADLLQPGLDRVWLERGVGVLVEFARVNGLRVGS